MNRSSRPWVLFLAWGILLALCLFISEWRIGRIASSVREEFREQSLHSIGVFTQITGEWLVHDECDAIRRMAELLIAGSGLYVVVATAEGTLVDRRADDPVIAALDLTVDPGELPWEPVAVLTHGADVDGIAPIGLAGYPEARIGYVRVGLSGSYAASEIRSQSAIIRGMAFGSLVSVLALTALAWYGLRHRSLVATREADRATIRCGELTVDPGACLVMLHDRPIELTPKMYDLVLHFAKSPGVTFSDGDLLAALWADSPYAASGDVKQCIYMVRQRFGAVHADPKRLIANVKGFGYRLVPPTAEDELRSD